MAVIDEQVAALRARFRGDETEYQRPAALNVSPTDRQAFTVLLSCAFFEAVDRRFNKDTPGSEIIEFVAGIRSISEKIVEELDPQAAERLIRSVFTDEPIDDLGGQTLGATQGLVLAALVADEQYDDAELDAFLAKARALADEGLG